MNLPAGVAFKEAGPALEGQRVMAHELRGCVMSIQSLMTAAEAAGYVMAAEEELPETFGTAPEVFEFRKQPATAVAIWRPVVPALDGKPSMTGHMAHAWAWLSGRFASGATA
jgi:hypothetical protein